MSLVNHVRRTFLKERCLSSPSITFHKTIRNLMSKNLYYTEFGNPLQVVRLREVEVPPLKSQEVLVRMLAAPVNPADINTIQGKNLCLPSLPSVAGDEGVGEVLEIGSLVCTVDVGERVVLTSRLLGTWRYYGIYNERAVHVISPNIPLPEASMLTIAPCTAYRMLKDFRKLKPGDTVIQNAANSSCGQCVIQLCKAWNINTINIVASHCGYQSVKEHLLRIGATEVFTLEEAEELTIFNTSVKRPVLALNCLGGRFEDVLLKLLQNNGTIVYYGSAFDIPICKHSIRCDILFNRFNLVAWDAYAPVIDKDVMMNEIVNLIVVGNFLAPVYKALELKHYLHALQNTVHCEAFATTNFVFDFTLR